MDAAEANAVDAMIKNLESIGAKARAFAGR
jgi:hypothetical protein